MRTDKELFERYATWNDVSGKFITESMFLEALKNRDEEHKRKAKDVCEWKPDEDGIYFTDCGNVFSFENGNVADNKGKYCFYCGKRIKEENLNE